MQSKCPDAQPKTTSDDPSQNRGTEPPAVETDGINPVDVQPPADTSTNKSVPVDPPLLDPPLATGDSVSVDPPQMHLLIVWLSTLPFHLRMYNRSLTMKPLRSPLNLTVKRSLLRGCV